MRISQLTDVLRCKLHKCLRCEMRSAPTEGGFMTDDTWSDVRFLTVYELALMMRISKMSAYRLVRTGDKGFLAVMTRGDMSRPDALNVAQGIDEERCVAFVRSATDASIASSQARGRA